MELADYFQRDDGSLPEIEVHFKSGTGVLAGLKHLFALGARDVFRLRGLPMDQGPRFELKFPRSR